MMGLRKFCTHLVLVLAAIVLGSYFRGLQLDIDRNICEFIEEEFQLKCFEHEIVTSDGFVIDLLRLNGQSSNETGKVIGKGPILAVHGFADSASTWVISGREHSLVATVLEQGYDVWLLNKRGRAPYKHRFHHEMSKEFWEFTFDEMIDHDVPDAIEYIHKITGNTPLRSIFCHSMGGVVTSLSLATHKARLHEKVQSLVILGSPIGLWGGSFPIPGIPQVLVDMIPPIHMFRTLRAIAGGFCSSVPWVCQHAICLAAGCGDPSDFTIETTSRALLHYPREASMNSINHINQWDDAGFFHRFGNREDRYDLSQLETPTALFYGKYDRFVNGENGFDLTLKAMPAKAVRVINNTFPWGHGEFIWAKSAKTLLHPLVLNFLLMINDDKE